MNLEDNYKLFNILLTSFIGAGGLGFINFSILESLGIIRQNKEKKDEKYLFILLFSIINYAIFLILISFPSKNSTSEITIIRLGVGILITLIISVLLSLTLYPFLVKKLLLIINNKRVKKFKIPTVSNKSPKEEVFSVSSSSLVYIFDFDKHKLGEGYLKHWTNDLDDLNQIVLTAPPELSNFSFVEVQKMFFDYDEESTTCTTRHLIDFNKKLHYFIFYQD